MRINSFYLQLLVFRFFKDFILIFFEIKDARQRVPAHKAMNSPKRLMNCNIPSFESILPEKIYTIFFLRIGHFFENYKA